MARSVALPLSVANEIKRRQEHGQIEEQAELDDSINRPANRHERIREQHYWGNDEKPVVGKQWSDGITGHGGFRWRLG